MADLPPLLPPLHPQAQHRPNRWKGPRSQWKQPLQRWKANRPPIGVRVQPKQPKNRSPFTHDAVAIAVTGARHLGRLGTHAPIHWCPERAARPPPRRHRRKHTSMPELERLAAYRQSPSASVQLVSIGPARTTVRVCEGAHVPSISRSASASGSVAVSCHVFLMAIQSTAYWHQ